jgi:hypothetical protein
MPPRRPPVWRSGTLAIRSEERASAIAVAKPATIVTTSASRTQIRFNASRSRWRPPDEASGVKLIELDL